MKLKKYSLIGLPIIAIILEILPYGAICNFATFEGEISRHTYSYFDLTPFGYANFGPLITAVLSCVLLLLALVVIFKQSKVLETIIKVISGIAIVTSLMPLMLGIRFFSVIGALISLVLTLNFCLCFIKDKTLKQSEVGFVLAKR